MADSGTSLFGSESKTCTLMELAERGTQACLSKAKTVLQNHRKTQNERNDKAELQSIDDTLESLES